MGSDNPEGYVLLSPADETNTPQSEFHVVYYPLAPSATPEFIEMFSDLDHGSTPQPEFDYYPLAPPWTPEFIEMFSDLNHNSDEAPGAAAALPTGGGVVDLTEDSD